MLGGRMRYLRRMLHLTQAELAETLGMSRSQLSMVENNSAGMSARTAVLIQKLFGLSRDWLLTGTGSIFLDWEMGVRILGDVGRITRKEEMLFLAELAQHFYQLKPERQVRGSIVRIYLELLDFLIARAPNINELDVGNKLPSDGATLPEKVDELREILSHGKCESSIADMILRELVRILHGGDFDLKDDELNLINGMIMPKALWLAKKAIHPDTVPVDPEFLRTEETSERRLRIQEESFSFNGSVKSEPGNLVSCSLVYAKNDLTVKFIMDFKTLYELIYSVMEFKKVETTRAGEWQLSREGTAFSMQLSKCSVLWSKRRDIASLGRVVNRICMEKDVYDAISQKYLQEFGTY